MISPARRRSKRAANIAINPAVTSSRAPMLKPLTMAGVAKLPISDDATDLRVDHPDPQNARTPHIGACGSRTGHLY